MTGLRKTQRYFRSAAAMLFGMLLITGLSTLTADAQTRFQWGINGQGGFPSGAFRDNLRSESAGLGLEFMYTPKRSGFGFGVALGFLIYGSESTEEYFQAKNADFDLDVATRNSILQGHFLLRYQIGKANLRPYLDALIGINHLTTDTVIEGPYDSEDDISTNNFRDTAFSYGAGVGLLIKVYDSWGKRDAIRSKKKKWELLIDLRVRYIKGTEAEYLKEGGITREDGELAYDLFRSSTSMFTTQIGVTFNF